MTNTTMPSKSVKYDADPMSHQLTGADLDGVAGGGAAAQATPGAGAGTVKFKEFTIKKTSDASSSF